MGCAFCGFVFPEDKIFFQDSCGDCGRDLHNCVNCNFFDTSFSNECKESSAERVVDKEKRNYCEYFIKNETNSSDLLSKKKQDLLKEAEALFKKK